MALRIERCLSIREPYAWLVAAGFKPVENRMRATPYRGRFAVHASQSTARLTAAMLNDLRREHPRLRKALDSPMVSQRCPMFSVGAIVGTVEIFDCVAWDGYDPFFSVPQVAAAIADGWRAIAAPDLSLDCFASGPVCYLLRNPVRFHRPIPCGGKLNLWRMPPDLIEQVEAAENDPILDPREPPLYHGHTSAEAPPTAAAGDDRPRLF